MGRITDFIMDHATRKNFMDWPWVKVIASISFLIPALILLGFDFEWGRRLFRILIGIFARQDIGLDESSATYIELAVLFISGGFYLFGELVIKHLTWTQRIMFFFPAGVMTVLDVFSNSLPTVVGTASTSNILEAYIAVLKTAWNGDAVSQIQLFVSLCLSLVVHGGPFILITLAIWIWRPPQIKKAGNRHWKFWMSDPNAKLSPNVLVKMINSIPNMVYEERAVHVVAIDELPTRVQQELALSALSQKYSKPT